MASSVQDSSSTAPSPLKLKLNILPFHNDPSLCRIYSPLTSGVKEKLATLLPGIFPSTLSPALTVVASLTVTVQLALAPLSAVAVTTAVPTETPVNSTVFALPAETFKTVSSLLVHVTRSDARPGLHSASNLPPTPPARIVNSEITS